MVGLWPGTLLAELANRDAAVFRLVAFAAALGAGIWLAALTVKYRDFRYVVPFLVQFGLYVSPVGFSSDVVPEPWRLPSIRSTRWSASSTASAGPSSAKARPCIPRPGLVALDGGRLLFGGIWYFRRTERSFADII